MSPQILFALGLEGTVLATELRLLVALVLQMAVERLPVQVPAMALGADPRRDFHVGS